MQYIYISFHIWKFAKNKKCGFRVKVDVRLVIWIMWIMSINDRSALFRTGECGFNSAGDVDSALRDPVVLHVHRERRQLLHPLHTPGDHAVHVCAGHNGADQLGVSDGDGDGGALHRRVSPATRPILVYLQARAPRCHRHRPPLALLQSAAFPRSWLLPPSRPQKQSVLDHGNFHFLDGFPPPPPEGSVLFPSACYGAQLQPSERCAERAMNWKEVMILGLIEVGSDELLAHRTFTRYLHHVKATHTPSWPVSFRVRFPSTEIQESQPAGGICSAASNPQTLMALNGTWWIWPSVRVGQWPG